MSWQKNITLFATQALAFSPTDQQEALFESVEKNKFVSCKSGHGTGKTTAVGAILLWFLSCFPSSQVVCTAPTSNQLRDALWARITELTEKMLPTLRNRLEITASRIQNVYNRASFAVARTARPENPDALQGFHSDNLLMVVDEASGVGDTLYNPVLGALTGFNNKLLLISNPTRLSGFFADTFKDSSWVNHTMNAEESSLVQDEQVEFWRKKYGEDSDEYKIRVLGEFPSQDRDALFSLDSIETAMSNELRIPLTDPVVWGIDVGGRGGDGDESILARRYGNRISDVTVIPRGDPSHIANWISRTYQCASTKDKPVLIFVDVIGIGAGVYSRLKELRLPVREVIASTKSYDPKRYHNKRAELYCNFRDMLDSRLLKLPNDEVLKDNLLSIEYFFDKKGAYQLIPKSKMIKSPDRSDAVVFTFAEEVFHSYDTQRQYTYDTTMRI